MGGAARHVQAELAGVVVVGDGLVAVGHGVDGAGHVFAAGPQDHRVGIPGEAPPGDLQQLGGVRGGGGLHVGVVVAAHALDLHGDAGVDVVDVAVAAGGQHAAAAVEPVHLDHLGLPGDGRALGRDHLVPGHAGGQHIAGHGAAAVLHLQELAALAGDVQLGVHLHGLLGGGLGGLFVDVGLLVGVGGVARSRRDAHALKRHQRDQKGHDCLANMLHRGIRSCVHFLLSSQLYYSIIENRSDALK